MPDNEPEKEATVKTKKREISSISSGFPSWPVFDDETIDAVTAVLHSGRVNRWTGQENLLFEQEFAAFVGCRHAIALSNGTVALELALHALDIGAGDEVIVTSRTFIASASAIVLRGAIPIIADVDPVSQNITAATIEPLISPRTRAVIAVHLAGWPCEMAPIMALARRHNLKIIEDCAQAHGATCHDRPVGSLGDVAAFSFCQDKIITTGGEGGMLVTDDADVWQRAWSYKDHGKDYAATQRQGRGHEFRWLHESFGTNARMTEMQAAIGRVALRRLSNWVAIRRSHAEQLNKGLDGVDALRLTLPPPHVKHAYYKYYLFVRPERLKRERGRDWILSAVNAAGVPCFSGSCSEIYLEKAFVNAGFGPAHRLPVARELGATSLMLLVHPTLAAEHIEKTCSVVREVLESATLAS